MNSTAGGVSDQRTYLPLIGGVVAHQTFGSRLAANEHYVAILSPSSSSVTVCAASANARSTRNLSGWQSPMCSVVAIDAPYPTAVSMSSVDESVNGTITLAVASSTSLNVFRYSRPCHGCSQSGIKECPLAFPPYSLRTRGVAPVVVVFVSPSSITPSVNAPPLVTPVTSLASPFEMDGQIIYFEGAVAVDPSGTSMALVGGFAIHVFTITDNSPPTLARTALMTLPVECFSADGMDEFALLLTSTHVTLSNAAAGACLGHTVVSAVIQSQQS